MKKLMSGATMFLLSGLALAAEPVVVPMPADANPTALILFALGMVGMIGGFVGYLWLKDRKQDEKA